MSAEEVVQAYLDTAFNMEKVEQKKDLMAYTIGPLKDAIAGATDETIKTAYIDKRYKLQRFALVDRRDRTPHETEITFQLSYKELPEGVSDEAQAVQIVTENKVVAVKDNGVWFIREVVGNRTSFDFPVLPSSRITATP